MQPMLAIESAVPDGKVLPESGYGSIADNIDNVRLGSANISDAIEAEAEARYAKHITDHPDQPATFLTKVPE